MFWGIKIIPKTTSSRRDSNPQNCTYPRRKNQPFWYPLVSQIFQWTFCALHIAFQLFIASEESILPCHMGPPKRAIKSLILVVEQFCIEFFFIISQFWIDSKHEPVRPELAKTLAWHFGHAFQKTISPFLWEIRVFALNRT